MVRARMEEKFYHSEVLRNLSDGFGFPRGRLDFANKGVTCLIDFTSSVFDRINRWKTCMYGEGKAFKARQSAWR